MACILSFKLLMIIVIIAHGEEDNCFQHIFTDGNDSGKQRAEEERTQMKVSIHIACIQF